MAVVFLYQITVFFRDRIDPCSGSESEADSPKSARSRSNGNRKPIYGLSLRPLLLSFVSLAVGGTMNNSYFTPPLIGRRRLAICSVNWYNGQ